jgi:hypothetical protein
LCGRSSTRRIVWSSALILLGASCRDPLTPGHVAGSYVLRQVGGDALPAVLSENGFFRLVVLADTLRLRPDGTGTVTGLRDEQPLGAGITAAGPKLVTMALMYHVVHDRIEMSFVCPPYALCVRELPQYVATTTLGGVLVDSAPGFRVPLVYQRILAP